LIAFLLLSACTDATTDNDNNSGDNGDNGDNGGNGGNNPVTLPTTKVTVDSVDYYLVTTSTQTADPYRYQINFGSEAQLQQNANELGQNSTFAIVMTFKNKPTANANFNFSSSRFTIDSTQVNFYATFFFGKGHARDGQNYLSKEGTALAVTIGGGKFMADIGPLTMVNEADSTDQFITQCTFDFDF
ncbi:MAG: hypothetical protein KDD94_05365, partial [Calditrichaeota bacterium]|nr:hypothetical protein [Calditrichota bacterium]